SVPAMQGELYDPVIGSWSTTGPMVSTFGQRSVTLLANGKVLVVGGYNGLYRSDAELYDPGTNQWTATGSMTTERAGHIAISLADGDALVIGGYKDLSGIPVQTAELYDATTGTWARTGDMTTRRANATASLLPSGRVLVVGGFSGTGPVSTAILSSSELYDPSSGTWSAGAPLVTAREQHT